MNVWSAENTNVRNIHNLEWLTVCTFQKQVDLTDFNLSQVNSKFHLIRSFFEIFAKFLPFHVDLTDFNLSQVVHVSLESLFIVIS